MDIVVVIHNVRSMYNVGSVFRTADAAGIRKIYLAGITSSPIDRFGCWRKKITKVSLGAEKTIPWQKASSIKPLIKNLKTDGYEIIAVEQSKKSLPFLKFKPRKNSKLAIIVGNEVNGLQKDVLSMADKILEIPMFGKKESLNVAVAFGIVIFSIISSRA